MIQIVKLILILLILLIILILTRGYFYVYKAESRNCYWKPYPKKKPFRYSKDEKQRRFIVSLENSLVMIATYDFEKQSFDVESVDAYREVPSSYKWIKKQIKIFKEKKGKNEF